MFGLNLWLAPAANRELVYLQDLVKSQFSTVLLREGVFNDVGEGADRLSARAVRRW